MKGQIDDAYPLSPLQAGMLFQGLHAKHSGVDIEQILIRLPEAVSVSNLERAWQEVADRHAVLRTGFRWDDAHPPVQEVHAGVRLVLEQRDWRGLAAAEQEQCLASLLSTERARGFELNTPPLMRLVLVQTAGTDYRLIWTFHHLLLDARGFTVVLEEVFSLYESYCRGRPIKLKPVTPYRAHIDRLQELDRGRQEAFWRATLQGFTTPTRLPLPQPALDAEAGVHGEQQLTFSSELTAVLGDLGRRNRFTVNTLLQGAWALLLHRYSGADDVLFGAIRACRRSSVPNADAIAGLLINTVPMRVGIAPDMSALEWLKTVRASWVAMRPYENAPLVDVQGWSGMARGTPMFDTLLSFQSRAWEETLRARDDSWTRRECRIISQPGYPLAVDASGGERLVIKILHDRRQFDDATAARMAGHLLTLLEGMVARPGQPLRTLPMLTGAERLRLMVAWNGARTDVPRKKSVCRMFEEQARRTPGALAVADASQRLAYRALSRRSTLIARHLRRMGVRAGINAAVCLRRSADMVTVLLAVLKTGGAYVPLDPDIPIERLALMTSDARSPVLVTEPSLREALQARLPDCRVVCPAELRSPATGSPQQGAGRVRHRAARPDDVAYVIYTSGSTGMPKGVVVEHRTLVNLINWHQQTYHVTPDDRATQLASPAFDASVWELWPYLTAGASIHIPDEETRLAPEKLIAWLGVNKVTLTFIPTPLAESMFDLAWPEGIALRALLTGGDRLHRWPPPTLPFLVVNHYGPTENTVVTTCTPLPPAPDRNGVPSIGRPIANTTVYVLDALGRLVPVGVPGELCIGGDNLARGYWNRPDLTAERFVPDPFEQTSGARLYKTGDLVRWREDGNLEFLGRHDYQVKLRGNRVELGEIESVLARHPIVRQCVVVVRGDQPGRSCLVAYVVLSPSLPAGAPPVQAEEDLRRHLREHLPSYMEPALFVFLPALPLTPNGKVDRQALPKPEHGPDASAVFVPPRTRLEKTLAGIWQEVLGVKQVGLDNNFFALGGHSLLAMQVIGRVRAAMQAGLSVKDLFDLPTVAQLAAKIETIRNPADTGHAEPATRTDGEAPLSFAQERMWFLEQLTPGKPLHNIPFLLRFEGELRVNVLEESLRELIRRHSPLRTHFASRHGRPVAVVHPDAPLQVKFEDLSSPPAKEREAQFARLVRVESETPFDITRCPLMRARLLRLGAKDHRLILTMHHLVFDGWSLGVFYRELAAVYAARVQGRSAALPELPVEYAALARKQREQRNGEMLDQHLAYWKRHLSGPLPLLNLPSDHPRPAVLSFQGATLHFDLPAPLTPALTTLAREQRVSLFMVLLAAFQTLLHRYSGQSDLVIGTPVAGRLHPETELLVGLFVNTLALRGDLSGDPTFAGLLQRTRQAALDAYAHQDVPFERLVEHTQRSRNLSHTPLFQAMFSFQSSPMPRMDLAGLGLSGRMLDNGTSKFDLTLAIEHEKGRLGGTLEFNTDLFDHGTAERMLGHFQTLLEGASANPDEHLSRLPLLTASEHKRVVVDWNQSQMAYPREKCIHQLFEEQAARAPDRVAVVCGSRRMTYRELNERADDWAARLDAMGVGPDTVVGLCVERSPDMLVGLLGILKAGGAYLPLDPGYPPDRLAFMLEDSGAPVLLTESALHDRLTAPGTGFPNVTSLFLDEVNSPAGAFRDPARSVRREQPYPGCLAYLIYTSGSTGKPKGVMVTHRNVVNLLHSMGREPGLTDKDVWLSVTTLSFDIAAAELLLPLIVGARVVVASRDDASDGHRLAALLDDCGATVMQATPSTWRMLLGAGWKGRHQLRVISGGEALSRDLASQLLDRCSGVWNFYGPTEATIWSTQQRVHPGPGPVSLGRPVANTQAYILDAHLQPVPIGVPGELHLGGDGIARGYLKRAGLTAERFIRDPFNREPDRRLYKTGDLARFLPDGGIEFLGRLDHQIKLRGHRIELGEIESVLRGHPAVRECVVTAYEGSPGDQRLAAYYVPAGGSPVEANDLRQFLSRSLPDYMLPSAMVTLDALPLTPNGKIDRKALPKPAMVRPARETAHVPPRGETERRIAGIWQQLLGVEQVGLNDTFFDLGGHSLLLVQLQSRLMDDFGRDVSVVDLFQHPTVGALAAWLKTPPAGLSGHSARAGSFKPAPRRGRQEVMA